jgi:sugar phosphate permease
MQETIQDVRLARDGAALRADVFGQFRWVVLLIAWAAFLMSFVNRLAWSSVSGAFSHSVALPLVELGVFVTAFYLGYVLSNMVAGLASDWIGPRVTLGISLLLLGIGTFLFGWVGSITAGLALQAFMGLTAGADYVAGVKLITTWFTAGERGRAMGVFMTASSLAVVLTNLIVPLLLAGAGWQGVYHWLGLVTAGMAIVALIVVRDGPAASEPSRARPRFGGLLRNRDLLLLGLAGFGALWGTWGFAFWASALMIHGYGISVVQAGYVVALFGAGAIVAKPTIGLVSDLMGGRRKALVIACLCFFVVSLLVFSRLSTLSAFEIMVPFLGVGAFAYSPLMNTMVAETSGQALAASGAGFTNAFWGLGNVIVPTVVGLVFQMTGSFPAAFVTLAVGPLLGAIGMAFVAEDVNKHPTGPPAKVV